MREGMADVSKTPVDATGEPIELGGDFEPVLLDRREMLSKDEQIRLAVMEALQWDLAIPPDRVTVEVDNGWVALCGRVRRAYSRDRAEWAARGAPGVLGVTNAITLED